MQSKSARPLRDPNPLGFHPHRRHTPPPSPHSSRVFVGDEASSEAPACLRDKFGTGKGGLALGIPGDAADDGGRFTGWADHRFGFNTPDHTGVTLSDCTFEVTALGSQLGGAAQSRASVLNASTCVTGAAN